MSCYPQARSFGSRCVHCPAASLSCQPNCLRHPASCWRPRLMPSPAVRAPSCHRSGYDAQPDAQRSVAAAPPGCLCSFSGDPARGTMLWAALLRAGPDAVLSHQTAAERHGLIDEPSPVIAITVPAARHPGRRARIPGVVIHRSDAILRTRHPAMLPPCTRVEDTVLDLIEVSPTFEDAYAWIARAIGRRRTTAERIRLAMAARKKIRWRREIAAALGDAEGGALSVLEYRYVHRVERPHGLPAARRQARISQGTGKVISTTSTRHSGYASSSTGPRRTRPTSNGATSVATTPMRSAASSRSGSECLTWAIADAGPRGPWLRCCEAAGGRALPARAGAGATRRFHDHGPRREPMARNGP